MHAREGIRRVISSPIAIDRWRSAEIAAASVGVVLLIGAFLIYRRASGALTAPLPPLQLVAAAALLFVWATLVRVVIAPHVGWIWAGVLPLCALGLFAVACSYPGQRLVDWRVWLPTIGAFLVGEPVRRAAVRWARRQSGLARHTAMNVIADGEVIQRLERFRTASGQDVVRGTLLAHFAPGERTVNLYAAFCPPFERLPQVEAEIEDDSSAVAKLVQVLHNGIQLEVRLARSASQPHRLAVEFFAAEPTDAAE